MKKWFSGKRLATNEEVFAETNAFLQSLRNHIFRKASRNCKTIEQSIELKGESIEKYIEFC